MMQNAAPATSTSNAPITEFRPVEGGPPARSGTVLMIEAYTAVWVILLVVLVLGFRKQRRLDERIARLEHALQKVAAHDE